MLFSMFLSRQFILGFRICRDSPIIYHIQKQSVPSWFSVLNASIDWCHSYRWLIINGELHAHCHHDDVMAWKRLHHYCLFVRRIQRYPHKGTVMRNFDVLVDSLRSCWTNSRSHECNLIYHNGTVMIDGEHTGIAMKLNWAPEVVVITKQHGACVSDYILRKQWSVFTHPCPSSNTRLANPLLKTGYTGE